jgi:hypothetical protein
MISLLLLFAFAICLSCACDEPNLNCGSSYSYPGGGTNQGVCSGKTVNYNSNNCSLACGYYWFVGTDCFAKPYDVSTYCNVFGCNCNNCAMSVLYPIDTSYLPPTYPYSHDCTFTCYCSCDTGPIVNAGQQIAVDANSYLSATIVGRREIISKRLCRSGQVSLEFVQHLEEIADVNGDKNLTVQELNDARDPNRVTLFPGCDVGPNLARIFPKISTCTNRHSLRHKK